MSKAAVRAGIAIAEIVSGLDDYAAAYFDEVEAKIGDDGVLGPEFLEVAKGLAGLLNGPTGNANCGALWSRIHAILVTNGFEKGLDT